MTIEEYELLDDLQKEEAVWHYGVFLENYSKGTDICDAYELFDFFVFFWYKLDTHEKANFIADKAPCNYPSFLN